MADLSSPTSNEDWLVVMQEKTKKLQRALVLRQFETVALESQQLLHEYLEKEPTLPVNELNGLAEVIKASERHRETFLKQPIDLYKPFPIPLHHLYPQTYSNPTTRHLSHRHVALQDDHPAVLCVGFIIAVIQKLGYLPTESKTPPHQFTKAQQLSDAHKNAYTVGQICDFLVEIYGTWVNITPSIILSLCPYFLSISPITAYLLTQHLLNEYVYVDDESEFSYEQMTKAQSNFVIKNLRFRRQLYVYLVQSIVLSLRLRYHTLYAPKAYPYAPLKAQELIRPSEYEENTQKVFQNVYFDISQQQIDLILSELESFTINPDNMNNYTEKNPLFPYFPTHLREHLSTILDLVDTNQDMYEFASYAPFDTLRIFGTGLASLRPTKASIQSSVCLLTKSPQFDEIEDPKDAVNASDTDGTDDLDEERRYVEEFKQLLLRAQDEQSREAREVKALRDHLTGSGDVQLHQDEHEHVHVHDHQQTSEPITYQKAGETKQTSTSSPIIAALTSPHGPDDRTLESSAQTGLFNFLPVAMVVTGLVARHRLTWLSFLLKSIFKTLKTATTKTFSNYFFIPLLPTVIKRVILCIPGVAFLLKMLKLSATVLYGKF